MTTTTPATPGLPFPHLLRLETSGAFRPLHLIMLILLSATGVLIAWWMPMWPDTIYQFFNRIFHIEGWAAIVLANNYMAFLFFLFWFGMFDVLRVYVLPLEGGYLDLSLSKPVARRSYMLAKLIPSFVIIVAVGVIGAVVHAVAMIGLGLVTDMAAYAGTIAAILGFVLLMLALANLLLLFVRDSFAALLVGFAVFIGSTLPSVVYMYRPDVFAGAPWLADILVFPTSLMWHLEFAAAFGLSLGAAFAAAAGLLVVVAGALLDRRDIT